MIIKIEAYGNGAHANQSTVPRVIPEGWAVVPNHIEIPDTFPFVEIEVSNGVVTKMMRGMVPEASVSEPDISPAELREQAYNTERSIEWDHKHLTVSEAAVLWQFYAAEGSEKASELGTLIASAKEAIRKEYPNNELS